MATVTFNFPTENTGTKTDAGLIETIQLSIAITTGSTNATYTAADYNVRCIKYGDTIYRFDLREFVAASGRVNYEIFDPDNFFAKYLTDPDDNDVPNIEAAVTFQKNGVDEFLGNIVGDTVGYDLGSKIIKFEVRPRIDLTKAAATQDDAGANLDPLGIGTVGEIQLESLIDKIFEESISGVTTNFYMQWRWYDEQTPPTQYGFDEIYLPNTNIVNSQFGDTNLFELLTELNKQFYAMSGLLDNGTAFFKNLFYYDASNVQTISASDVIAHSKEFDFSPVDYVTVLPGGSYKLGAFTNVTEKRVDLGQSGTVAIVSVVTDSTGTYDTAHLCVNPDRKKLVTSIDTGTDTFSYSSASYNGLQNDNDIQINSTGTMPAGVTAELNYFIVNKSSSTFQISATVGGAAVNITSAGTGVITYSESMPFTYELANSWYERRHTYQSTRVDTFVLNSLGWDFIKNFTYGGKQYQIIELRKHWQQGKTTIKALVLGDSA